jgi:ADP-ribose pyrophosphatase
MTTTPEVLLVARRFRVVRHVERSPDGSEHVKDIVEHPGAVTIVPMVDDDHVCLIRNARVAVGRTLVELPAGTLEPGEDPAHTAARELIEETGYRAATVERLVEFFMSPGILSERMHVFVARGLTQGNPQREAGEQIENLVVSWADAMRMIDDGTIQDAKTLASLLVYDRLRFARQ